MFFQINYYKIGNTITPSNASLKTVKKDALKTKSIKSSRKIHEVKYFNHLLNFKYQIVKYRDKPLEACMKTPKSTHRHNS